MKTTDCRECIYRDCQYCQEIEKSLEEFAKVREEAQQDVEVTISKMNTDKQLIFGWANVCKNADGTIPVDWAGDVINPEDLEVSAYSHVLKYRATGERHQGEAKGILVESMMFTKEKMVALGIPEGKVAEGWWVGYFIPDEAVFAKCKSGEYGMFSIQGGGIRQPLK